LNIENHLKAGLVTLFAISQMILVPIFASNQDTSNACIDCHSDRKFFVQNKKLFNYYQDWLESPHNQADVVCNDCHGGDPEGKTKWQAHQGTLIPSDDSSPVFFRNQPKTCGECHKQEASQFSASKHYQALMGNQYAPTCSTCHRTMNRKPYFTLIVEETCKVCHFAGNENDLPLVAERVHRILNRLNSSKGYLNWTALYFREKNWPGNSKAEVRSLQSTYKQILTAGHRFNLKIPDDASIELLTRLKKIYREIEGNNDQDIEDP